VKRAEAARATRNRFAAALFFFAGGRRPAVPRGDVLGELHPRLRDFKQGKPFSRVRDLVGGLQALQRPVPIVFVGTHDPPRDRLQHSGANSRTVDWFRHALAERSTGPLAADCNLGSFPPPHTLQPVLDLGQIVEAGLDLFQKRPLLFRLGLACALAGFLRTFS